MKNKKEKKKSSKKNGKLFNVSYFFTNQNEITECIFYFRQRKRKKELKKQKEN